MLFDLDGTLTDSGQGILNSVAYVQDQIGIEEPNPENLKRFIGPSSMNAFPVFIN
ncbi:TPA: HAD hydrolase-like protein [Streptococcus suis]